MAPRFQGPAAVIEVPDDGLARLERAAQDLPLRLLKFSRDTRRSQDHPQSDADAIVS